MFSPSMNSKTSFTSHSNMIACPLCTEQFDIVCFLHCPPPNNLKIHFFFFLTEPVTIGIDATVYVWFLGQILYCIYIYTKAGPIPLHPLQPWQARFLCGDSDYFWHSVQCCTLHTYNNRIFRIFTAISLFPDFCFRHANIWITTSMRTGNWRRTVLCLFVSN